MQNEWNPLTGSCSLGPLRCLYSPARGLIRRGNSFRSYCSAQTAFWCWYNKKRFLKQVTVSGTWWSNVYRMKHIIKRRWSDWQWLIFNLEECGRGYFQELALHPPWRTARAAQVWFPMRPSSCGARCNISVRFKSFTVLLLGDHCRCK